MRAFRFLAVVFLVALVALCALFSLSAHSARDVAVSPPSHAGIEAATGDSDPPDDSRGNVDLFGNDVSDAVARYRLDATGSLYEVHSPQTEIPKLAAPKS